MQWVCLESDGEWIDPRGWLTEDPSFGVWGDGGGLVGSVADRQDGRCAPLYRTELELDRMRQQSRRLANRYATGTGIMESLTAYVLGSVGFSVRVLPRDGVTISPQLVARVQAALERCLEQNRFQGGLDAELHRRTREDGEAFVALRRDEDGVRLQVIEPEQVTEPRDKSPLETWLAAELELECEQFEPSWTFGVLSDRRSGRTLGYHVVRDEEGRDWEFLPVEQMLHLKRNVPLAAKRGVSDFLPVLDELRQELRLSRNLASGAALQAAIAWIEESPQGTSAAQIGGLGVLPGSGLVSGLGGGRGDNRLGGAKTDRQVAYEPGTILRPSPGRKYVPGPLGAERNANFLLVSQHILRRIGSRWNMPEYLISGDASNGNYASALVAEAPFVKARERDQQWLASQFRELFWKLLDLLMPLELGRDGSRVWMSLRRELTLKIDCPAVATRNALDDVLRLERLRGMGLISRQTAAAEAGYDWREERRELQHDPGRIATGRGKDPLATDATGVVASGDA